MLDTSQKTSTKTQSNLILPKYTFLSANKLNKKPDILVHKNLLILLDEGSLPEMRIWSD